ncbi:MAG: hypothetical protein AAGE76_06885 [Pseudomonadota bacterium]
MSVKSRVSDKTSAGEKFVAITFVLCASVAVFIGMHKKDIEEGRFMEVVASYLES